MRVCEDMGGYVKVWEVVGVCEDMGGYVRVWEGI